MIYYVLKKMVGIFKMKFFPVTICTSDCMSVSLFVCLFVTVTIFVFAFLPGNISFLHLSIRISDFSQFFSVASFTEKKNPL